MLPLGSITTDESRTRGEEVLGELILATTAADVMEYKLPFVDPTYITPFEETTG